MPKIIKNEENGTEETVYTAEELETQKNEALEQYKADHPDQADRITELQSELETAQKALEDGGPSGSNFKILRQKVETLTGEITKVKNDAIAEINKVRIDMSSTALDVAIKGLAGEDAELAKKVKLHFNETLKSVPAANTEEFQKKLQQAYLLAAGVQPDPSALSGAIYGSGGAGPGAGGSPADGGTRKTNAIKPEVVEMGKKYFGLSEDDFKKYDKRDFSRTK